MLAKDILLPEDIEQFQAEIYNFYKENGRVFQWRQTTDPYHIVVSEIMLQQTQTHRVEEKYKNFVEKLPNFLALAEISTRDLLLLWQGLGYNRRALSLQKTAQIIMQDYGGQLPNSPEILLNFPGIGPATASSICVFAFNTPTVFIETNIRAVYIHKFFQNRTDVTDKELFPLVEQTLDKNNSRHWYYALMDYGVMLKKKFKNPSRKSAHHTQQSKFEGSERQIRGMILRALTAHKALNFDMLCALIDREPHRIERNLQDLCTEGFVQKQNTIFYIQ